MDLAEARKLIVTYAKNNFASKNENWMLVVQHSFRVENYAVEISEAFPNLSQNEIVLLRKAAIFHDIGSILKREDHAKRGMEITKRLLPNESGKNRILKLIAKHSEKNYFEDEDLLLDILKDADILDQIGAMSILMFANKYNYDEPMYYENVLNDLSKKDIEYCYRQMKRLRTKKAKQILNKKIEFIKMFIEQLKYETKNSYEMIQELIE